MPGKSLLLTSEQSISESDADSGGNAAKCSGLVIGHTFEVRAGGTSVNLRFLASCLMLFILRFCLMYRLKKTLLRLAMIALPTLLKLFWLIARVYLTS